MGNDFISPPPPPCFFGFGYGLGSPVNGGSSRYRFSDPNPSRHPTGYQRQVVIDKPLRRAQLYEKQNKRYAKKY